MPKIISLLALCVALGLPFGSARAGSKGVQPSATKKKPLAKLVKGRIVVKAPLTFASWRVQKTSYPTLRAVARIVRKHRNRRLSIGAHTDSRGSAAFNQRVSQQRADAVAKVLYKMGVPWRQLLAIGFGENRPIASNRTPAGRRKNRRIELRLVPLAKRR